MATESLIDRQFTDAYNQIHELYDNDELDECIEQAQQLLQDPAIPRYHRMKTYILLVSTIGEWTEANGYRSQAETLWRIVRRWHPEGEDAKVDAAMQELRTALDALKNELEVEQPEDYDPEEDVEAELAAHDERVAEEVALAEAENDDPVELAKADKVAVAAMSSKMDEMEIDTKKPKKPTIFITPAAPTFTSDEPPTPIDKWGRPAPSSQKWVPPFRRVSQQPPPDDK